MHVRRTLKWNCTYLVVQYYPTPTTHDAACVNLRQLSVSTGKRDLFLRRLEGDSSADNPDAEPLSVRVHDESAGNLEPAGVEVPQRDCAGAPHQRDCSFAKIFSGFPGD